MQSYFGVKMYFCFKIKEFVVEMYLFVQIVFGIGI